MNFALWITDKIKLYSYKLLQTSEALHINQDTHMEHRHSCMFY
jgi:hypothetical protein